MIKSIGVICVFQGLLLSVFRGSFPQLTLCPFTLVSNLITRFFFILFIIKSNAYSCGLVNEAQLAYSFPKVLNLQI